MPRPPDDHLPRRGPQRRPPGPPRPTGPRLARGSGPPRPAPRPQRSPARKRAAQALALAAERFPDLPPAGLDTADLDPREARLALAIHRTALQRWLTLEHLLNRHLRQPAPALEPRLRGVLLAAAAQIVFMDRLPVHAVVDESVDLARFLVRPGAAAMVNAILRRLSEDIESPVRGLTWVPAPDRLPLDDGYAVLRAPLLPPLEPLATHLAAAASHPPELIKRWIERFGPQEATRIAEHGVLTPPTIVAVEESFEVAAAEDTMLWRPHAEPGFLLWEGTHAELVAFLAEHPARRVQDPQSAASVPRAAAALTWFAQPPALIVDYCAGRGTKTRQLAALFPAARVLATDVDPRRLAELRASLKPPTNIEPVELPQLREALGGQAVDVLLLDVPCSNTGVLGRRPEARYRFDRRSLNGLVRLQRRILEESVPLLRKDGALIYSTCSLEDAENTDQATWAAGRAVGQIIDASIRLPEGRDRTYHDGAYHALVRVG